MLDKKNPEDEPRQKRSFIREKVVKQPLTRRQVLFRAGCAVLAAAACGAAAGTMFAVVSPVANRYLGQETAEESKTITIPRDEPETSAPPETASEPVVTKPEQTEESMLDSESFEEQVQEIISNYEYTTGDFASIYTGLKDVVAEADHGIVTVHSVKHGLEWFDNPVETSGLYAGAVIGSTPQEYLILVPDGAVENADSIKVTFADGSEVDGSIRQMDQVSGMAMVSVRTEMLNENTADSLSLIPLGNSYSVRQGDPVIAVGAPAGIVHSSTYGFISYVVKNVQVPDGMTRLLLADINGDASTGTFLLNLNGQMIGWVTNDYDNDQLTNLTTAMAISDYKTILEKMSNGIAAPYLGIRGQEVSTAMEENGMPSGVYVADCIQNGPAYNAGIQNGDIVVKIGEKEISSMKDYENQLENLRQGDTVTVTVQRKSVNEYKELEYQVKVGAR